jgi:hypothetical protein
MKHWVQIWFVSIIAINDKSYLKQEILINHRSNFSIFWEASMQNTKIPVLVFSIVVGNLAQPDM